jgi:molybdopterin converting factor small subunit|tara:strand:+ start:1334 stop:1582 length:249 start_codon:yes stop_codon:yes gene_type:complete
MVLKIILFSILRDAVGEHQIEIEVPFSECNIDELLQFLYEEWAELRKWDSVIRAAVDHDYVDRGYKLRDGHVVALMPPMQGG